MKMHVSLSKYSAVLFGMILGLVAVPFAFGRIKMPSTTLAAQGGGQADQAALVAQGKKRFDAYKCYDCHGMNGEGTPDGEGPDLTHSRKTAEEISKFLAKPSGDAVNKGMPDIPVDNPDHAPLVAYVMSLRAK
jgi:mono/diheme cytochrome c family protein